MRVRYDVAAEMKERGQGKPRPYGEWETLVMQFPIGPEDVKIVQGASGRGLQVMCVCGAVNWNHLEMRTALWPCRNCERVFTQDFPGLVAKVLKLQKTAAESQPQPATT